jgi:hypothetical protein
MQMKRTASVIRLVTLASTVGLVAGPGCLNGFGDALSSLFEVDLLGANPSSRFSEDGLLDLSILRRGGTGGIGSEDCDVTIEDEHGGEHSCDWVGDDRQPGSGFSAITLLIDGSGSMEVTYPESRYGDFCLTCPHDPNRLRVSAARDFIGVIGAQAPDTVMSVMSFGPAPTRGWHVTQVLSEFTSNPQTLHSAVGQVGGYEQAGTPLYDSLAEIILATDRSAETYAAFLRQTITVNGNNNDLTCPPSEGGDVVVIDGNNNRVVCGCGPDDTVIVDGNNNTVICEGERVSAPGGTAPGTGGGPIFEGEVPRVILLLSDGEDHNSVRYGLEDVIALANAYDITIHAVGLGPASASFEDPRMRLDEQRGAILALQRLADETGGIYASVRDAGALRVLYRKIADGLTSGYHRTGYVCEHPAAFTSGQRVHGTAVCNGEPQAFSFFVP